MRGRLWRQGDVLVELVDEDSVEWVGARFEERHGDRVVLAHGESGNAHVVIDEGACVRVTAAGERYLRLLRPATLTHEEHRGIDLPAGLLRIVTQREFGDWPGGARDAID